MSEKKKRELNYQRIIGWSIAGLIVIILAFIIIKIKIWDKGEALDTTIDDNPDFDYETSDVLTLFPIADKREDDDGVLTIAIFGNDSFAEDASGYNLITDNISTKLNATVLNFSLPGSLQTAETSDLHYEWVPVDAYSLYGLLTAVKTHDYSAQREWISYVSEDKQDYYLKKIAEMEQTDFNTVDVFMFCYDGHDYYLNRPGYNNDNPKDIMTLAGSIDSSIDLINESFPNGQIVYCAPTYCELLYGDTYVGADLVDYGFGSLPTAIAPINSFALANLSVSYIDLYFGSGIGAETAAEDLEADRVVPTEAGKTKIANRIVRMLSYLNDPVSE